MMSDIGLMLAVGVLAGVGSGLVVVMLGLLWLSGGIGALS